MAWGAVMRPVLFLLGRLVISKSNVQTPILPHSYTPFNVEKVESF